jgi:hypothetical protein
VIKDILVKGRNYAHDNTIIYFFYRNNPIGMLLGLLGYVTKMDHVINTTLFIIFFYCCERVIRNIVNYLKVSFHNVNYLKVRFHDINKGKGPSHISLSHERKVHLYYIHGGFNLFHSITPYKRKLFCLSYFKF